MLCSSTYKHQLVLTENWKVIEDEGGGNAV
jgi:hypothetical protein